MKLVPQAGKIIELLGNSIRVTEEEEKEIANELALVTEEYKELIHLQDWIRKLEEQEKGILEYCGKNEKAPANLEAFQKELDKLEALARRLVREEKVITKIGKLILAKVETMRANIDDVLLNP